jgi:hypothetical protein
MAVVDRLHLYVEGPATEADLDVVPDDPDEHATQPQTTAEEVTERTTGLTPRIPVLIPEGDLREPWLDYGIGEAGGGPEVADDQQEDLYGDDQGPEQPSLTRKPVRERWSVQTPSVPQALGNRRTRRDLGSGETVTGAAWTGDSAITPGGSNPAPSLHRTDQRTETPAVTRAVPTFPVPAPQIERDGAIRRARLTDWATQDRTAPRPQSQTPVVPQPMGNLRTQTDLGTGGPAAVPAGAEDRTTPQGGSNPALTPQATDRQAETPAANYSQSLNNR